jgi:hypothetical protein
MSRGVFPHSHGAAFGSASPRHILGPHPLRAALGVKAIVIHRLTCRHASGVALSHCLQTSAAVQRRKAMSAPERIKTVSQRGWANAQENDESNGRPAAMHGVPPAIQHSRRKSPHIITCQRNSDNQAKAKGPLLPSYSGPSGAPKRGTPELGIVRHSANYSIYHQARPRL